MNTMYDQIAATAAREPSRAFDRLIAELDVRGWLAISSEHKEERRALAPMSGRGHAVIEASIAIGAAERMLYAAGRSTYSIGSLLARSVMWTANAIYNLDAADAAFDELCDRGVGDYDTPRREVPIREEERAFIACVLGCRVGDDVANW